MVRPTSLALVLAVWSWSPAAAQPGPPLDPIERPVTAPASPADEAARDAQSLDAVRREAWDDALALTRDLVSRYGEQPHHLSRLAAIYDAMHRPADEVATWERFVAVSPEPWRACPRLGRVYRGLGQYDQAVAALTRCLAARPDDPQFVYYAGLGYEWAGQLSTARAHYTRATALAPPGLDYQVSIARLDLHEGRLAAARDRAAAVVAPVATHPEAALVAGLAEQRAGHRREARTYLEVAARQAPEYFDVRLALGILDYSDSRLTAARGHFEAAFLSDPSRRAEVQPWLDRTAAK